MNRGSARGSPFHFESADPIDETQDFAGARGARGGKAVPGVDQPGTAIIFPYGDEGNLLYICTYGVAFLTVGNVLIQYPPREPSFQVLAPEVITMCG